ncbi:MAG: phosphoribosylglycinamide formyltransferase [Saprospiraceae bacterium]|nr:phosphoribosylglycinamide formyltransferase [Saprospiraceae bacterium]
MKHIAIFASGHGTNAKNIIHYFKGHRLLNIALIVSSQPKAGVLEVAAKAGIPAIVLDKKEYYGSGEDLRHSLITYGIDGVVLAGFLWLIPSYILERYAHAVINIHPALLPKYGGKGMYGLRVHQTVWANRETSSGITIHEVNAHYDEGKIIFQASCPVSAEDTPDDIAQKVHQLEYTHYPKVMEDFFLNPTRV